MDQEPDRETEYESPEEEGIPDTGGPPDAKRDTGDPQEGLVLPRDEPTAVEDDGTTAAEQREGQPIDERLAEEEPDKPGTRRRDSGRLVQEDPGLVDEEKEEVAEEAEDDTEGRSAEESAVHIEEEPGGLTGGPDHYVPKEDEAG
jgi:hypothetical protein